MIVSIIFEIIIWRNVTIMSKCVLLIANIDEFEKSKKTMNSRFPDENTLAKIDSIRLEMINTTKDSFTNEFNTRLEFYQIIVNELEFHRCFLYV
jgi:hypothetical protein